MDNLSLLQRHRLHYQPSLPTLLQNLEALSLVPQENSSESVISSEICSLFPNTHELPLIAFEKGTSSLEGRPLQVGIVLSGGQAPGGHTVIAGLWDALKKIHPSSRLFGFLDGPEGIVKNKCKELTEEIIAAYRNQGGFDMIGSGRTKIESSEQLEAAASALKSRQLDGLVIVGGDDSNTNAAFLAEYCKDKKLSIRIIGVPKTIDGDLKNAFIEISFGFDTASKIYSETIGNLAKDSLSAKKYYFFIKMMGRSASHLTLECALQTHVNMALIGEEIAETGQTLHEVVQEIATLIIDRSKENKDYGIILIPEGLLEFIPECQSMIKELNGLLSEKLEIADKIVHLQAADRLKTLQKHLSPENLDCFSRLPEEIQTQLLLDRDPHGNIQLSKIETERLLIALVEKELKKRSGQNSYAGKFNPQPLFCGYEGRCGLPTNFDCQYCYALGFSAALLIKHGATGYMCCIKNLSKKVEDWKILGVPIVQMLHFEMRKNKQQAVIRKALVDLKGVSFLEFKKKREKWRLDDSYLSPGPIQFEGPTELTDAPPISLSLI